MCWWLVGRQLTDRLPTANKGSHCSLLPIFVSIQSTVVNISALFLVLGCTGFISWQKIFCEMIVLPFFIRHWTVQSNNQSEFQLDQPCTSVSQIETLRDSFVGGLLRRGEDDLVPALLGLDELCGFSDGLNTLLVFSKSGVAELRLREAKLASSPLPKAGWEFPTFDLLPVMELACVLGVGFCRPESFFTKASSLLLCFP